MSQAKLLANRGHFYCPHVKPVLIDCNFTVDSTNGNGFGVRSVKGQGIQRVYMNTSAYITGSVSVAGGNVISSISQGTGSLVVGMPVQGTDIPAGTVITSILSSSSVGISQTPTGTGASETITYQAIGNPNPGTGIILVQFGDNYMRYYGGFSGFVSPVSGSPLLVASAGLTPGVAYVIVSVGTTTYAGWLSLGMPPGITPAVGVTFVPSVTSSTTATGTGVVETASVSGIGSIEVIGDPNTTINPIPVGGSPNVGGWIALKCLAPVTTIAVTSGTAGNAVTLDAGTTLEATGGGTVATTTVMTPTAPADGATLGLSFYLGQSSVTVDGE